VRELVDPRVTRRLVALELSDVDVDPPHDAKTATDGESVYVRVMAGSPGLLDVELWSRGELSGRRHVSTEGSSRLRARRIALASAELCRALQRRRQLERKRADDLAAQERAKGPPPGSLVLRGAFDVRASLTGATVGSGELTLFGPSLGLGLQFESGPGVELRFEWFGGATRALAETRDASALWYGATLRPYYAWAVGDARSGYGVLGAETRLEVGAGLALAGLRLQNVVNENGTGVTAYPWTARAAGDVNLSTQLSRGVGIGIGVEVGALLHPISVDAPTGPDELGAFWLSGTIRLTAGG